MRTEQIIRGAAEVLTITRLTVNDVYKRVDTNYSGEAVLRYGVVTDVMENGPDAAVVVLEFRPADFGSGVEVQRKVINGQVWAMYPARPDEVAEHFAAVLTAAEDAEKAARESLEKAQAKVQQVRQVTASLTAGTLTAPATSTTPLPEPADVDDNDDESLDPTVLG